MEYRPGIEELYASVETCTDVELASRCRGPTVFIAPTGYGKTRATLLLASRLLPHRVPRVVHALPLRAILEQAYMDAVEALEGVTIGYQAMGLGLAGKSPFVAPRLVYITFDSLLVNLLRGNVAERGLGHYEVPRAHLLASLLVMDEVHLGLWQEGLSDTLYTTLFALRLSNQYFVLETATLPPAAFQALREALGGEYDGVIVAPRRGCADELGLKGVREVVDKEFYTGIEEQKWSIGGADPLEAVDAVVRVIEEGGRALVVLDSVERAVEAYRVLLERVGEEHVALVHSRMTPLDRRRAVEKSVEASRGDKPLVLVGTSAVEAGVDFDADILVTTVPRRGQSIAFSSLIQRMGRVCRRPRPCRPRVLLLEGDERLVSMLSAIHPRVPCSVDGVTGYYRLLEHEEYGRPGFDVGKLMLLLGILDPLRVEIITRTYCDLVRGEPLLPLLPVEHLGDALRGRVSDYIFPARFSSLAKRGSLSRFLARGEKCARIVRMAARGDNEGGSTLEEDCDEYLLDALERGDCYAFTRRAEAVGLVALLVEGYREKIGLVGGGTRGQL